MFEDTMSVQSYSARGNQTNIYLSGLEALKTNLDNLLLSADRLQIHRLSEQVEDETDGDKVNK